MSRSVNGLCSPKESVRILLSERAEWMTETVAHSVHCLARLPITVVTLTPRSMASASILEWAASQSWELGILFLNNILYPSGDRSEEGVARDSAEFVREVVQMFKRPVIGLYAYPDLADYPDRILGAGAAAIFRVPFGWEEMQQALKRCLPICNR